MNPYPMIRSCCNCLDNIVLRPKMTFSLSTYNRRTGACSEQKCISLSGGFTLLRGMMLLAGGTAVAYGAMCLCRYKERQKLRRAIRKSVCKDKKVSKP